MRNSSRKSNLIALLSLMNSRQRVRPMAEDDYRWLVSGIKYLFEVDAETPAQRRRLMALRKHVSERVSEALDWQPRKPRV